MSQRGRLSWARIVIGAGAAIGLGSCAMEGMGPPNYADCNSQMSYIGMQMTYDCDTAVWETDQPGVYYHNGYLYKLEGGQWSVSRGSTSPNYTDVSERSVPDGLR